MSESKQTRREVIDAELKKTKAELAIAKHRETKLRNQPKDDGKGTTTPQHCIGKPF